MGSSELCTNVNSNFRNALYACVLDALSDNAETRRIAENRIRTMELTADFGPILIELSLQKDINFSIRQMSCILLKQYIDNFWVTSEHGEDPLPIFEVKPRMRQELMQGLREPDSKIRNSFAYCLSYIGTLDWPHIWDTYFDELNELLMSDNEYAVAGVMRVFDELIRELEGIKIEEIGTAVIDHLLVVLEKRQIFRDTIRLQAVEALTYMVQLFMSGRYNIKDHLIPKLPVICELFVNDLQLPDKSICDYGYKTNIIRFLTLLVQKVSKVIALYLNSILPTMWRLVMTYGDLYTKSVICNNSALAHLEDEEGKLVGFVPLVLGIFDFIHSIVDCPRISRILIDVLPDILYYDLIFLQITKKTEEEWISDPNGFFEYDTNDSYIHYATVRATAKDVLILICSYFEAGAVVPALCHTLNRHLTEAETSKQNGSSDWWKVHEACMYTLGLIKDVILTHFKNGTLQFDLATYIEHWQLAFQHPEFPLLLGRCLWFGGTISHVLTEAQFKNYMQSTLSYLTHNEPVLRMFPVRAVIAHCEEFSSNPNKDLIVISLVTVLNGLLDNLNNHQFPVLYTLSLQTIKIILPLDKSFTVSAEPRVMPLMINIFLKHNADPDIMKEIREIIKVFCLNTECIGSVQEKFIPVLANILNSGREKVPPGLHSVAMDLLQTVVKCSKPPLSDVMIVIGFTAVVKCMIRSDDYMVLLNGEECLRSYLLLGVEQITNYTDSEGKSGLEYIMQATSQILDPICTEHASLRVGRLIITLINKAGSVLGTSIHFVLRAILSKMNRVETMDVWESLLIVFVYLFYTEVDAVVSFLTSIPGPTGVSALEFVLVEWLNRQVYFLGLYARIVSVVGLAKLLEYSVTSDYTRFDDILVRDEFIQKETGSQKQQGWTKIPVLLKAFKIIISELAYQTNSPEEGVQSEQTSDDEDSDDETATSQFSDGLVCDEPEEHDPLYARDPLFQINILAHLTDFLHKFKTIPRFQWFVSFLSESEKQTLASIGIY